ncbi:MAG: zinc-dependent peptidase [Betaproteobacteria bacterium]|nr:MAG: zinc-dependent peptidase [Betaproteobacteria bacterium]TMG78588.1 MAG: zinc-dependent peptidase [Betaproteobacteria bacterium]
MGFLREWRRKRVLKSARLDEALWARVAARLSFLRGLSEEETMRLKRLVVLFLSEKEMHGTHGLELTDEVRLSIAAQACLPILNLGLDVYSGWVGVIVYPGEFRVRKEEVDENGIVHTFDEELAGEAWPGGPVILSWEDVGLAERGYNVVIHEFAHKIHMDGGGDSDFPAARAGTDPARWRKTLEAAYERFCNEVDAGRPTFIDEYASEHPAEFFAVMSEAFFTESAVLARDWPELYAQLAMFYRQDPAGRASP